MFSPPFLAKGNWQNEFVQWPKAKKHNALFGLQKAESYLFWTWVFQNVCWQMTATIQAALKSAQQYQIRIQAWNWIDCIDLKQKRTTPFSGFKNVILLILNVDFSKNVQNPQVQFWHNLVAYNRNTCFYSQLYGNLCFLSIIFVIAKNT